MNRVIAWAARRPFTLAALAANAGFVVADSILDAFVFHSGEGLLAALLHPTPDIGWMRAILVSVLLMFGLYADRVAGDRRRDFESVEGAERFNREVLSSIHEGLVVYDRTLRCRYWNPFMESITGVVGAEIIGRDTFDLFPELRAQGFDILRRRALAGETVAAPDTPFFMPRTGRRGWHATTYAPHRNAAGEIVGVIATVVDVTERRKIETALQQSAAALSAESGEEFFRSLVRVLAQAVEVDYAFVARLAPGAANEATTVAVFAHGVIVENYTYPLAGTFSEQILQTGPRAHARNVAREFPQARHLVDMEAESCAGIPLMGAAGRPLGVLVVYHSAAMTDLAFVEWVLRIFAFRAAMELERLEMEEKQRGLIAELEAKNRELEQFAYTISHDLKSPLISIRGFLGLLDRDLSAGDTAAAVRDAARIHAASERMQILLTDLLKLSRTGRALRAMETVRLADVARDAAQSLIDTAGQPRAAVTVADDLPAVIGDRGRLTELMEILLGNAVQYMGDQPHPAIVVGSRRDGGRPVVFVRDNGIGIERRHQERIFGLFERLDPRIEGTGVGLAIARRIVELHGGRIWVESDGTGTGSTFCFTIGESSKEIAGPLG